MTTVTTPHKEKVFATMREILADITEDWDIDLDAIAPESQLIDLGIESISLVYLIAELQQEYGLGEELFRKMRSDGTLLKEMTIDDVLNAMAGLLEAATAGGGA